MAAFLASRMAILLGWRLFWLPGRSSFLDGRFFGFPGLRVSSWAVILRSSRSGFLREPPSWAFFPPDFFGARDPGDLAIRIAHSLPSKDQIQGSFPENTPGSPSSLGSKSA